MRQAIGPVAEMFTDDEILDGLTSPHLPLTAWTAALPQLRAKLSLHISECTTDDDLLRAARRPSQPLVASGACKIQVCQRQRLSDAEDFRFPPERLGRRIDAKLWAHNPDGPKIIQNLRALATTPSAKYLVAQRRMNARSCNRQHVEKSCLTDRRRH